MLNPVQEYAKARSMPIPALVAVLQGKSDMVSLGVAHAALKEKTQAEIARKGANAAAMMQAPKQIERDLALAQGLAAMPTDVDVPMGGIVGAEGDMSTMAAGGGMVAFSNGGQSSLLPDDERLRAERVRNARPGPGVSFSQAFPNQTAPTPRGFTDYLKSGARSLFGRVLPITSAITGTDDLNVGEAAQLDMYRTLLGLGYSEDDIANMPPQIRNQIIQGVRQTQPQPQTAPQASPEAAAPPAPPPPPPDEDKAQPSGIASLQAKPIDYAARMDQAAEMAKEGAPAPEKLKTAKDFMKERDELLREAGYDFNLVKDQIKEAREEKEKLKGDKKEAMNLRLIEAGLGILGGESPYAFVNIGKGATPALQGLAKDIKDIKKESRAYDKEVRQLNAMQNEITAGRATYGIEALNKQAERVARREENIQRSRDSIFGTIVGREGAKEIATLQSQTQLAVAGSQAKALETERALARSDARAKAALDTAEEAARDIMDPTEKANAIKKYFREFYAAAYGSQGAPAAPRARGSIVNGVYTPAGQ